MGTPADLSADSGLAEHDANAAEDDRTTEQYHLGETPGGLRPNLLLQTRPTSKSHQAAEGFAQLF